MEGNSISESNEGKKVFLKVRRGGVCLCNLPIQLRFLPMSLIAGYSSDEDDSREIIQDAFSINSLPAPKKIRFEDDAVEAKTFVAAPDVLAEVGWNYSLLVSGTQLDCFRTLFIRHR